MFPSPLGQIIGNEIPTRCDIIVPTTPMMKIDSSEKLSRKHEYELRKQYPASIRTGKEHHHPRTTAKTRWRRQRRHVQSKLIEIVMRFQRMRKVLTTPPYRVLRFTGETSCNGNVGGNPNHDERRLGQDLAQRNPNRKYRNLCLSSLPGRNLIGAGKGRSPGQSNLPCCECIFDYILLAKALLVGVGPLATICLHPASTV